jgi:predicted MPP superfamily phosphohydrolase
MTGRTTRGRGAGWRGKVLTIIGLAALLAGLLVVRAWRDTMAEPVVRRHALALPGFPAGSPAVRLVLHVAGPDMPPSRLARIVAQVNALRPDLVLIAGDLVSDKRLATQHYSTADAVAPLAALTPTIATVVVPGNHDHWRNLGDLRWQLARIGAVVLANEAQRFGPLVVGGLDDDFTGHADLTGTLAAMEALGGAQVLLSHSPDPFPEVPRPLLMLAGHTHCGQHRYFRGYTPATMSRYGERYACGLIREAGKTLVVTAGLGTSVLPFRFGTRPDLWLIEVRGVAE